MSPDKFVPQLQRFMENPGLFRFGEAHPACPESPYGVQKLFQEHILRDLWPFRS